MKFILISVKDLAVQAFQPISTVRAEGEALRGFMDAIANPDNKQLHNHPDDFELYVLGHYDDTTAKIEPLEEPKLIMRGKQAKQA